ncbi:MAG: DinB family protein [Acidimicrobiales bacterium]
MPVPDDKDVLHRYLKAGRESMLWKLDGLSEYDVRRPMVPTATNLLGLVKHLTAVECGYFGETFGRPFPDPPTSWADAELHADMWATADEPRQDIVDMYRRANAHADATVAALDLHDVGRVPWWPEERAETSLLHILVHVATETHRHAGHADLLRELIDGAVGLRPGNDNMAETDPAGLRVLFQRVEDAARRAAGIA